MKRSKINRFLSLICALAMVVSATSVPAFADDQPEEPGTVMTEPVAGSLNRTPLFRLPLTNPVQNQSRNRKKQWSTHSS